MASGSSILCFGWDGGLFSARGVKVYSRVSAALIAGSKKSSCLDFACVAYSAVAVYRYGGTCGDLDVCFLLKYHCMVCCALQLALNCL
jgi:hypothetical protein